jgi:putative transposase
MILFWLGRPELRFRRRHRVPCVSYLANYTHRVALSNRRILAVDANYQTVTFTYRDYRHGSQLKELTLSALEFIRRFSLHILPPGLVRTPSPASLRSFSILVDRKRSGRFLVIAGGGKEPIEIGLRDQPYRDGDEFGDIVGVEFAQAQFDRGKKVCARLDEHQ